MIKTAIRATVPRIQRIVKYNDIFKHYKGNVYRVIAVAKDTETEEHRVIYHNVMKPDETPWDRPLDMFNDYVMIKESGSGSDQGTDKIVPRFERYEI